MVSVSTEVHLGDCQRRTCCVLQSQYLEVGGVPEGVHDPPIQDRREEKKYSIQFALLEGKSS
jgi:hypothetical protein